MKTLYESILDDNVEGRFEDDMIKIAISKFIDSRFWQWTHITPEYSFMKQQVKYTINKDSKGWYIDTEDVNDSMKHTPNAADVKDFVSELEDAIARYNKYEKPEVDVPVFRWRTHKGRIILQGLQAFNNLKGLPDEIDSLTICATTGIISGIDLGKHKIKKIFCYDNGHLELRGHPKVDEVVWSRTSGGTCPEMSFHCKNVHSR